MNITIPELVFDNRFVFELQDDYLSIGWQTKKTSPTERAFIKQYMQIIYQFMVLLNSSIEDYNQLKN